MSEFTGIGEKIKECPDGIKELILKIHTLSLLDKKKEKVNFYMSQVDSELLRVECAETRSLLYECKTILEEVKAGER